MSRTETVRWWGAVVAVALLSGCGPASSRTAADGSADSVVAGAQGSGTSDVRGESIFPVGRTECVGAVPADAVSGPHLAPGDDVTDAAVCSETTDRVAGNGVWTVRRVTHLSGSRLAALATALRVPDTTLPPGVGCAGVGHMIPVWVLTLADGRHVQPAVPGDGCDPSADVLGQLSSAVHSADAVVSRVHQLESEALAASGCYDSTKFMVIDPPQAPKAAASRPVRQGAATVCRFDMTDGSGVETKDGIRMPSLTGFGDSPAIAAAVDRVYETFTPGYPKSCTKDRPTAALTVQAPETGTAGNAGPQTYLEVGGCSLVLDSGIQVIGSADPQAVAALSALATHAAAAKPADRATEELAGTPLPESSSATQACAKALVGQSVVSSSLTTVGEARRLRVGPGSLVLKDSFTGIPDSGWAAWCWTRTANAFDAYAVSGTDAVKVASIEGLTGAPTGAPQIP